MNEDWEIRAEQRTVVTLYRVGKPIRNEYGHMVEFASVEEAQRVAEHWDEYRMPTYAELKAMSDDQLIAKTDDLIANAVESARKHIDRFVGVTFKPKRGG